MGFIGDYDRIIKKMGNSDGILFSENYGIFMVIWLVVEPYPSEK